MDRDIEIKEAKDAINTVLSQVKDALDFYRSARKWGYYDMFLGGIFTSAIKRSKISRGNEICEGMRKSIDKLRDELEDVDYKDDFFVPDRFWDNFWDLYFDNVFSDFMVQEQLENIITRLEVFQHRLEVAHNNLKY